MTIFLTAVDVKHERRIRLVFTTSLASGAFGVPAPTYYAITSLDGIATPPGIQAAYVVSNSPNVVELSFDAPLVRGALYDIAAIGIPAVDTSVTDSSAHIPFRWGFTADKPNQESPAIDRAALLYGVDLIWNGVDYQENAVGDLDRISGPPNVSKALNRGVETNPGDYPYDPSYGAGAREFVDSPSTAAGTLKGSVAAQILRDPRVKEVRMSYTIDNEKTFLFADPTLISGEAVEQVSIQVPNE